jgi:hypothetical protein
VDATQTRPYKKTPHIITGGEKNLAEGVTDSIGGGYENTASRLQSSVSGGAHKADTKEASGGGEVLY